MGLTDASPIAAEVLVRRSLRTVVSVGKNWLFSGSTDDGDRAAAIYSCLALSSSMHCESGTLSAVRPGMVANHIIRKIDKLLPWNIRTQVPSLRIVA